MKRGITVEYGYDRRDIPCVIIRKKRGKLTLEEIGDILRYEDHQQWNGYYAILLNCSEATIGGNGCMDMMDEPPGDMVYLYALEDSGNCPVCAAALPPVQYCPNCGNAWAEPEQNIETLLASMKQEAERCIKNPQSLERSRKAWYWSHIGSIDLARQLGLITEARRLELYAEMNSETQPVMQVPDDGYKLWARMGTSFALTRNEVRQILTSKDSSEVENILMAAMKDGRSKPDGESYIPQSVAESAAAWLGEDTQDLDDIEF